MKRINTELGSVYILDKPYWAGEHTFHHCSDMAKNSRRSGDRLWSIDVYTREGINPISHDDRKYIWANDEKSAARQAMKYAGENKTVLLTYFSPLEDKLLEPSF